MKKRSLIKKAVFAAIGAFCSITASANVAKVGDTEYPTLQDAFDAVKDMAEPVTVTLLQDIGSETAPAVVAIPECNDEITFDMGGFKVVGGIDTYYSAKVTIKNGAIESYNSDYPIHAKKGHIVLRDITLWSKSAHGVRLEGSENSRITCEIYSGNYDSNGSGYTIYARNYSDLIIYGGTFTDGTHCVNVQSTNTGKIYGGSFTGIVYAPVNTQLMMVYGGKFTGTTYLTLGTGYRYTSTDSEGFISVVKADYALTVNAENATVSALNATYQYEDEVKFTVTPASGYKVTSVKLGADELTADEDGNYSFSMPAKAATITVTTESASTFDVMINGQPVADADALKKEAKAGTEMTVPETSTWTADGNVLKKDGEAYVTFADYYTVVVVDGTTVTLKLNKPVIGESTEGVDDAFTVTTDKVTIKITNFNSVLKYGVRSAADISGLSAAEIAPVTPNAGVITLEKATGNSAFYEVVVSDVDFPTASAE